MWQQFPTDITAGDAPLNPSPRDAGASAHLPSMPPFCRSAMPDQQIINWTPAPLAGTFFAMLRTALTAPRFVSRTSTDDIA